MATNSYHPGIYCKSQSTKNTASIVLDSQLISLSKSYQKQTPIESKKDTNIENKHDNEQEDIAHFFHPQNYSFSSIERHKKRNVSTGSIAATMCSLELLPNMDELNNYHKHKQLGTGTDAHVYEVIDCRDKTHVAMKLTKRKSGRYRTEIHLLHKLKNCKYVVTLLNVLEDPSVYVLILEQAPMTLEMLLHERCIERPMKENVAKEIIHDILLGIVAINDLGFVHKDIKPENILLFADRKNRKLTAKIADFGFATRVRPIITEFSERVNDKCGTPGFWAPELVVGRVNLLYAFRMDVFSVGVTLYRMLCNEMPFGLFEAWNIKQENGKSKLTKMKPHFQVVSWIRTKNKIETHNNNKIDYLRKLASTSLSKNGVDLLRGMLRIRPHKRFSVSDCLNAQFFV